MAAGTKLGDVHPVFPRADKSAIEGCRQMEEQQRSPAMEEKTAAEVKLVAEMPWPVAAPSSPCGSRCDDRITIDDFAKSNCVSAL